VVPGTRKYFQVLNVIVHVHLYLGKRWTFFLLQAMELQPRFSNGTFKVFLYVASRSPHSSQLQSRRSAISRRRYLRYLRENFWNSGMCIRQQEPRNPALLQWAENARPIKAFSGQVRPGFRENRNRFCRFCSLQEIGFPNFAACKKSVFPKKAATRKPAGFLNRLARLA